MTQRLLDRAAANSSPACAVQRQIAGAGDVARLVDERVEPHPPCPVHGMDHDVLGMQRRRTAPVSILARIGPIPSSGRLTNSAPADQLGRPKAAAPALLDLAWLRLLHRSGTGRRIADGRSRVSSAIQDDRSRRCRCRSPTARHSGDCCGDEPDRVDPEVAQDLRARARHRARLPRASGGGAVALAVGFHLRRLATPAVPSRR